MRLVLLLLSGGGSLGLWLFPEDFDSRVKDTLTDKNRIEEVRSIYSDMEDVKKEHKEKFNDLAESFEDAMKSSTVSKSEIDEILNEILIERDNYHEKIIAARMNIVKSVTAEEWAKIYTPSSDNDN